MITGKKIGINFSRRQANCDKLVREVAIKTKQRESTVGTPDTQDVESCLLNNKDYFLAIWASMLDKLLYKPAGTGAKPTKATREAREKAGKAFKQLWEQKKEQDDKDDNLIPEMDKDFKAKWEIKKHPYSANIDTKSDFKDKPAGKGSWYQTFAGDTAVADCNWDDIAKIIYTHLYEKQYEKNSSKPQPRYHQGKVQRTAKSIKNNVRNYALEDNLFKALSENEQRHIEGLSQETPDWNRFKDTYQLNKLTKALKEDKEGRINEWEVAKEKAKEVEEDFHHKKPKYLQRDAITCLYQHYASIFTKKDTDEVIGTKVFREPQETDELKKYAEQYAELYRYHCMIKEALIQRYPKYASDEKKINHEYDANLLHKLALKIEQNRQLAFAIRLGKVIHYQGGLDATSEETHQQNGLKAADPKNINKIISSHFWTSIGQTQIKQNESFVRQWMGAVAVANTTLTRLLDPENKVKDDVLTGKKVNKEGEAEGYYAMLENLNTAVFDKQFKLLFGDEHKLYGFNKDDNDGEYKKVSETEQRLAIINDLRNALAQLRHATFHFKNINAFNHELESLKKENKSTEKVNNFIKKNQQKQLELLSEELRSAHAESYLDQDQMNKVWGIVKNNERNLLPLPKFNKLLQRADNVASRRYHNFQLIKPATATEMDANTAFRCSFISSKLLYDYGYAGWLKTLIEIDDKAKINKWITSAQNRATQEAENITNDKTGQVILSKMSRLNQLGEKDTLEDYFSYLTQEISSEFQTQNNYQADEEEGRKLSNYVEEFKQDILLLGFKEYLDNLGLLPLLSLKPNVKKEGKSSLNVGELSSAKIQRPWIYMLLHLMPVEFVNHLALQIRKHHVLTHQKEEDGKYAQVYRAISLHLSVYNALQKAEDFNAEPLKGFFENEETFNALFTVKDGRQTDYKKTLPIKGLREILRFGNVEQLVTLFAKAGSKVSDNQLRWIKEYTKSNNGDSESRIAIAQKKRLTLHKNLTTKKTSKNKQKIGQYTGHLKTIREYKELKNHIYLHNHKQAHQLIMQVLGRLAGFSQLWERDIYFYTLTLFMLRKIDQEKFQSACRGKYKNFTYSTARGQINSALDALKDNIEDYPEVIEIRNDVYKQFNIIYKEVVEDGKLPQSHSNIRNDLAHFNALYDRDDNGKLKPLNLTNLINQTRTLMSYDRKIKNAVSKSIIELLERENLLIKFRIKTNNGFHDLSLNELKAKTIYHLGGKKMDISETLYSETYVNVIKKLFKPSS